MAAASGEPTSGSVTRETAEEFVDRTLPYIPAMTRLAARMSTSADADDIVQEALIRAWRKRDRYDPNRGSLPGWLLAVTADQARRWRSRFRPWRFAAGSSPAGGMEEDLDLESAIAHLSGRQRLAIDCYYFVGLSVAETADVMSCSEGTVKSTLSDARDHLRRTLGSRNG